MDTTLDTGDIGDDVLRRFRYQITYSCIVSLTLITSDKVSEVICEHYEDILVKLFSNKCIAIQVKTKELANGPFECDDIAIVKSISRFIKLEQTFPYLFERFVIVTNNDFSNLRPSKDLRLFIQTCKEGNGNSLLRNRLKSKIWIEKLSRQCNCDNQFVIDVLQKVDLKPYSSINDIRRNLVGSLQEIDVLKDFTYGQLEGLAGKLIEKHLNAASLDYNDEVLSDLILKFGFEEAKNQEIIKGKKITKDVLKSIIEEAKKNPVKLFLKDGLPISEIPNGYQKLEMKLDAGCISNDNILLFKDNKYSVENLMTTWLYRDPKLADKKYNQIRLIIQNECQSLYDELKNDREPFGMKMLIKLRANLRKRYEEDKESFYDCKLEHLLGMAGVLTEECKVWWSEKFNLES